MRKKGIIPQKPKEAEITEDDIVSMLEKTIQEKQGSECLMIHLIQGTKFNRFRREKLGKA